MAEIVLAYCASHAPVAAAAPGDHRERLLGALDKIREEARDRGVQSCVVLSNEHFTNFFLENFPQISVGLGERNWGPAQAWLPTDKVWIPGHPALAEHIIRRTVASGFDPAYSHLLELDAGVMTVYHELDPSMRLPLVPVVQNGAVAPLMPLRRWYAFGRALGEAIRSYPKPERVAVAGAGGLCGDADEEFDRWFLDRLEQGRIGELLDLTDAEIELAGNGAHEIRSWLTVAGAAAPGTARTLAYEPVYPWLTGMAVSRFETAGAT